MTHPDSWSCNTETFFAHFPGARQWTIGKNHYFLPQPSTGGKAKDVTQCQAFFVDFDQGTYDDQLSWLKQSGLPHPSLMVHTGGKGIHAHWLLDGTTPVEQWRPIQHAILLAVPHCDQALKDPSRKMRLPGYLHPKTGTMALWTGSGHRYPIQEIIAALPMPDMTRSMSPNEALHNFSICISKLGNIGSGHGTYEQARSYCQDMGGAARNGGWPMPTDDMQAILRRHGADDQRVSDLIRSAKYCDQKNGGGLVIGAGKQRSGRTLPGNRPSPTERYRPEIDALPPATPKRISGSSDPESPAWDALLPGCERLINALQTVTWSAPQKPATAVALFLAAISASLRGPAKVEITSYWYEAVNLFHALVADSGEGKSYTLKHLCKYPLGDVMAEVAQVTPPELPGWKARKARLLISADTNNEGTLKQLEANEKCGRHQEANGRNLPLVVYADELHGLLSGLDRYHSQSGATNHADAILQWYDGDGATHTARADEDRQTFVWAAAYHIMGSIQWTRLTNIIQRSTGAGLWGRLTMVPFWSDAPDVPYSADPGKVAMRDAMDYLKRLCTSAYSLSSTQFAFSDMAAEIAWNRRIKTKHQGKSLSPIEQEIMGKSVGHECRYAAALHIVTSLAQGITPQPQIDIMTQARAHQLQQYVDAFSIHCHTDHAVTPESCAHEWLHQEYPQGAALDPTEALKSYAVAQRRYGWPVISTKKAMSGHLTSYGAQRHRTSGPTVWLIPPSVG